jgi:hypothetical protein
MNLANIDPNEIRALLDKQAITEVLSYYSRGIDRKDPQLLVDKVYWPDATDDHILYKGDIPGLLEFNAKFTVGMPTMHFLGNVLIDLLSATCAFSETYYIAFHDMPSDKPGGKVRMDLTLGGRYLDRLEKRGKDWRIIERTVAVDWYTQQPGTADWDTGLLANLRTRGRAKPHDPLYRLHPAGVNA